MVQRKFLQFSEQLRYKKNVAMFIIRNVLKPIVPYRISMGFSFLFSSAMIYFILLTSQCQRIMIMIVNANWNYTINALMNFFIMSYFYDYNICYYNSVSVSILMVFAF